jgi:hypothetical protein
MECKRNCRENLLNINILLPFRERFWGDNPKPSTRREKIRRELSLANIEYTERLRYQLEVKSQYKKPFVFHVDGKEVCEKAFVNILGIADFNGQKTRLWNGEVSSFLGNSLYILFIGCQNISYKTFTFIYDLF